MGTAHQNQWLARPAVATLWKVNIAAPWAGCDSGGEIGGKWL